MLFTKGQLPLFNIFGPAVHHVAVREPNGEESGGSCFHIGNGVFITASHVVEDRQIVSVGRDLPWEDDAPNQYSPHQIRGPFFHPGGADVAAFVVEAETRPVSVRLEASIFDDTYWLDDVLLLGYPRIPLSRTPVLVAASSEINAGIEPYIAGHQHPLLIVSAMARGGFSGGLALHVKRGVALGLITESLVKNDEAPELGFFAVLTVGPVLDCLEHAGLGVPHELES